METLLTASLLIVAGTISAVGGYALFRVMLPILGFFAGYGAAFATVETLFANAPLTTVWAVMIAVVVGLVIAAIAYFYYTVGIILIGASLGSGVFALIGQALGLNENGLLVFLLSISGAVVGALAVVKHQLQDKAIAYITAFYGVGLVLVGVFLSTGSVTMENLSDTGILATIAQTVDTSWIWLFVWVGASVIAASTQIKTLRSLDLDSQYSASSIK